MSFPVCLLAKTERPFSVRFVRNDTFCTACSQPPSQFRAVISLVAEQPLRGLTHAYEGLGHRTIMRRAVGQQEGNKTSFGISDSVDFRIAPATRASDCLILLPPFPPEAERCALICVESIICVSVDRPRRDNSVNILSHTPRLAQRTKRL
jgi:hypothetical protein